MGFKQCKMEADIWMRIGEDKLHYEYIAVYVDDVAIASKDPTKILDILSKNHGIKLKSTGPLPYHLGCDYTRDLDGTLAMGHRKYIEKLIDNYEHMFKDKPKEALSALEKNEHPKLDVSELLNSEGIKQ
jgi:hypothetical protein